MNNHQKLGIEVEEAVALSTKVGLIIGMVSAFLVGAVLVSSLFSQPSVVTNQTTKKEKTTVIAKKYATPVDSVEFNNSYSIPSDETKGILGVNKFYDKDTVIPLKIQGKIIGLSVDANVTLKNNLSFARVILVDKNNNEYLVSDTSFPFEEITELKGVCEETCQMNSITPSSLKIELSKEFMKNEKGEIVENDKNPTASIEIFNINYLTEGKSFKKDITRDKTKISQQALKVKSFNSKGRNWVAGETDVSKLAYSEKKKLFGGKLPNLCGFEYYEGGYFEFCERGEYTIGTQTATVTETSQNIQASASSTPFSFDWRNRHGQDWMTPVRNQLGCGSCWAFGAVGAVEAVTNLYFNHQVNIDLAEQDLVSCSGTGNCGGGSPNNALDYISIKGIVDENCFPYTATNNNCVNKCADWQNRVFKISNKETSDISTHSYFSKKNDLLKKGPLSMADIYWSHAVVLVGFGDITPGIYYQSGSLPLITVPQGDPLIGKTYWLIKNSWGTGWGENGYAKMIYSVDRFVRGLYFYPVETPITTPIGVSYEMSCTDNDNDGYCFWGISPDKPSNCPSSCNGNNISDCDDSSSGIGACSDSSLCGSYPSLLSGELTGFSGIAPFDTLTCCGDSLGEYTVGDRCCNDPRKVLEDRESLRFNFKWGAFGSGEGQFYYPRDILIYQNQVYIMDMLNHRIQIFDLNGQYLNQWGTQGSGDGEFSFPIGFTFYNNKFYIADSDNHRIQIFDLNGQYLNQWGTQGSGDGEFNNPRDVTVYGDKVYVADMENNRIQIFDLNGGYLSQWGSLGSGEGQLNMPTDLAINNNNIYVTDSSNNRIEVFDLNGQYLNQWGSWGSSEGQFWAPEKIVINNSKIYVADTYNHRIQVFNSEGNFINLFGRYGSDDGEFGYPTGMAFYDNKVYITDILIHRIQAFDQSISKVCVFGPACSDGTPFSQCSTNKPQYCDNGNLVSSCQKCGCPTDKPYCNQTTFLCEAKCTDGTPFNKCSTNKPKYCNNQGKFIDSCLSCGCPRGQTCKKMTGYPAGKCVGTSEPTPAL